MDVLKALEAVGLPGWVLIAAGIVFILRQFGILGWLFERLTDSQEHQQSEESEREKYRRLQDSWQQDKLATLLEEDASYIREQVSIKMDSHDKVTNDRLYRVEMTLAQIRDTISVMGREVYALKKLLLKGVGTGDDD